MWSALTRGRPLAKKDVVLGNDTIEILIELDLLTNFGAMNRYIQISGLGSSRRLHNLFSVSRSERSRHTEKALVALLFGTSIRTG